jgi:hypothetical protein
LEYISLYSSESQPTFRRSILPTYLGSRVKVDINKKQEASRARFVHDFVFANRLLTTHPNSLDQILYFLIT